MTANLRAARDGAGPEPTGHRHGPGHDDPGDGERVPHPEPVCPVCGGRVSQDDLVCPHCGASLVGG